MNSAWKKLFTDYRCNAKKRGISWNLTREAFYAIALQRCHYCRRKAFQRKRRERPASECVYMGIDRKSNNRGYSVRNCVPCCKTCNFMKCSMGYMEFLHKVKKIHDERRRREEAADA